MNQKAIEINEIKYGWTDHCVSCTDYIDTQKSATFNWVGWVENGKYWKEIYPDKLLFSLLQKFKSELICLTKCTGTIQSPLSVETEIFLKLNA